MSDNRNALLDILAETQKLMHQRRVQGLVRASQNASGASTPARGPSTAGGAMVASGGGAFSSDTTGILVAGRPQAVKSINYIGARDSRGDFFDSWSRKIEAFVNDSTLTTLDLPAELDSNDRRLLHTLAEKFNLGHMSAGKGAERHLVLKKDVLFYSAATKVIDRDAIEALKNKKEAAHGSRYHLRRVHNNSSPTDGTVANREDDAEEDSAEAKERERLAKVMKALDRATDQFAFATDASGASVAANGNMPALTPADSEANRYLSHNRNANAANTTAAANTATAIPQGVTEVPNQWASAMQEHKRAPTAANVGSSRQHIQQQQQASSTARIEDVITYEEQCTRCNTSSVVDYDISEWAPIGLCETCRGESVFRLVERKRRVVVTSPVETPAPAEVVAAAPEAVGSKRSREEEEKDDARAKAETEEAAVAATAAATAVRAESIEKEADAVTPAPAVAAATPAVEAIVTNDDDDADEEEELIPMEVDDLVSMLECNDHDPAFVAWCRTFAADTLGGDADAIGARMLFVMELGDVPKKGPMGAASNAQPRLYCKLSDTPSAITALVDDVWRNAFGASKDVIVGLPNISVSGINVEVVIHGPIADGAGASLDTIKARVGGNRLAYGTTVKAVVA